MKKIFWKMSKKTLALLMSAVMVISCCPIMTGAAESSSNEYIEIYTVEDLYAIRNDLTATYILMNDIDLTEATAEGGEYDYKGNGWNSIDGFSGTLDGNGYSIIGLRGVVAYTDSGGGLFGTMTGTVRNLGMVEGTISSSYSMYSAIGFIAKTVEKGGIIENCYNTGEINVKCATDSSTNLNARAGGIVGSSHEATISKCYNTGNITAKISNSPYSTYTYAGGITGKATDKTIITDCYNTGTIIADSSKTSSYYSAGIGNVTTSSGSISNCYNVGSSYRAIGYDKCTQCYYLRDCCTKDDGATELTQNQLSNKNFFVGFDFENTWVLDEYAYYCYPQLRSNVQNLNGRVDILRIVSLPIKNVYYTGDELDLTGCTYEAIYASGTNELANVTTGMISGYDPEIIGEQTVTVRLGDKTDTFTVTVKERPEVKAITLINQPNKSEYLIGTEFDFTGAQIRVIYTDATIEVKNVTLDMTSGGNINHLGTYTITVTFGGKTCAFDVEVIPIKVERLEIKALPEKLLYIEGEEFEVAGFELVAVMNTGRKNSVSSGYTVDGYSNTPGKHTITVTYLDASVSFEVTVLKKTIVSLLIKEQPYKTEYYVGDSFDGTGMTVVAIYDNGESEVVNDYTVTEIDNTVGYQTVKVSYGGLTVGITVTVYAKLITGIEITSLPLKLNYLENDAFDTDGMVVVATYNDGTSVEITDYEVVGFSSNPGNYTLSVVYEGMIDSFDIVVKAKELLDIVVTYPDKLTYCVGETFDSTGLTVYASYDNGLLLDVTDYTITGFDSSVAGTRTITVTWEGFSKSFAVSIVNRSQIITQGSIKVNNTVGRPGEIISVPVSVTRNTGLAGFCHTICFDPAVLAYNGIELSENFSAGNIVVNEDNITDGRIVIVWYNAVDIKGSGDLYSLDFEVNEDAEEGKTLIEISFDDNDNANASNEDVIFSAVNGEIDIVDFLLGDIDGDRMYTMADIVTLAQYVSEMDMAFTEKQELAADVNCDGVIDVHDTVMLSQWLLEADI